MLHLYVLIASALELSLCSFSVLESETAEEESAANVTGWFLERQTTSSVLGSIDTHQASKFIKQMSSDPQAGVVYLRADDSLFRYKLG